MAMGNLQDATQRLRASRKLTRRSFFVVTAGMAAILAGCGGDSDESGATGTSGTQAPASSATPGSGGSGRSGGSGSGKAVVPLFTTENDPQTLAFYEATIAAFKEEHPDVEVEITLYQDENQLQYLTTAFETGTDLGIFAPPSGHIATWARQGHLLPIDPIIERIGPDDFLPGTRIVVDGSDYAMPFQANASAVWVRQDLIEAEGLPLPTTYEEYLAIAETLHGKDGIIGIASATGAVPQMTLQFFTPYILQSGWDYFDREGNLTFDQPDVLEAVKRFAGIMKYTSPSLYNGTYQDILTTFISGRAALGTFPGRLGVNLASQNPEIAEKTTVVPPPVGPFMTGQLFFGGIQHYVVHSKTAHPEEALAFLEFMTTGTRALEFAMTVPGHLLPPLESVRKMVPDYESEFMSKHGDWVRTLNDMVPNAMNPSLSMGSVNNHQYKEKLSNVCPWAAEVWGSPPIDGTMFQEILIQGKDPEQAWSEAAEKMRAIAERWKSENPDWTPTV